MTQVYVDLETLVPGTGGAVSAGANPAGAGRAVGGRAVGPADIRSLGYLTEAGHEVVLVADLDAVPGALAGVVATVTRAAPTEPAETSWYLTTDVERCRGRSAKLRTVLVGTAAAPSAIHRCDTLARDIQVAVLELLAAEAMPAT